jgi:hypothetical protein
MRKVVFALLLAAAMPALGQRLEPGDWAFTTTTTSNGLKAPLTTTTRRCIRNEDAASPQRWMAQRPDMDCQMSGITRGGDSVGWDIACRKSGWRGTGRATVGKGTLEAQTRMGNQHTTEKNKIEVSSKINAKRLGPCR